MIRPVLLTGRAGSGKTYRCLAEIAALLKENPEGAPLLMVAPRQATYQLERQILSFEGVEGFTRLRIVSFQRLADFVFEAIGAEGQELLDEQGRIMVLRALLARHRGELKVYGESARHDGLARELSDLWREMVERHVGPKLLLESALRVENPRLAAKLADFALLFGKYAAWLKEKGLRDGDELLDIAAEAAEGARLPEIGGLWVDGFAQMTPQERRLLLALLTSCKRATLAFCLPPPSEEDTDALSTWSLVGRTHSQLRVELTTRLGVEPEDAVLPAPGKDRRFEAAPALAHLEAHWASPKKFEGAAEAKQLRVARCASPEAEAIFAAREILKFTRNGGRFREAAVLVRSLENYHDIIKRVFKRYGIPCFLDRRESVAHHPLAELTRGMLRSLAFDFAHRDFFAALKSGLWGAELDEIDWLENLALARAWRGNIWQELTFEKNVHERERRRANELRDEIFKPIARLKDALGAQPTGTKLALAIRAFWDELGVEARLEEWDEPLHEAVWTQMVEWLDSVALAFGDSAMPLRDWLQIVDAGLSGLTVGLIPPALDQTLVGAVDRSRNPDLKAVFLLGANEGVFPAVTKERVLLSDLERDELARADCHLAEATVWNLGRERFYGYIACTRARQSVTVTFAGAGSDGSPANPSIFVAHLKRLFPGLEVANFDLPQWPEAEAPHELNALIFKAALEKDSASIGAQLMSWPIFAEASERARLGVVAEDLKLSPATVERIYGKRLRTSASRFEEFASCAFRFFVTSGLRAKERLEFQLDAREKGAFTHAILAKFHERVQGMGKRWKDVAPETGQKMIAEIAAEIEPEFQDGLTRLTPTNRFEARAKVEALQTFIGSYLELLRGCDFDPQFVELPFGFEDKNEGAPALPIWTVPIEGTDATLEFGGRIDRIDWFIDPANKRCLALVLDYKSSGKTLDRRLIENAIQQQLPAYLAALRAVAGPPLFPYPVEPAGAFYVNLRPRISASGSRAEAMDQKSASADLAQDGIFDAAILERLDPGGTRALFKYPKRGSTVSVAALPTEEFRELIEGTEARLRELGRRVFAGEIAINPYAHAGATACEYCPHASICRIDPWTHDFRKLE